ncbi:hypothetical protein [Spongiactinospora sp. TRM90649]|uniref:hypothetical protein n=1 Tax=Spongiactinospora sp. TRM90649 TaxID=3031114 RepID=UPI0023F75BE4|nr:hypothetical protein [Spongiactinospora sp. TRM90649]MDF5751823.1 hypothetical protein [Spongiactinospora sp. TRM90649]
MTPGSITDLGAGAVGAAVVASGSLWLVALCGAVVVSGALTVRARFRRGAGPYSH